MKIKNISQLSLRGAKRGGNPKSTNVRQFFWIATSLKWLAITAKFAISYTFALMVSLSSHGVLVSPTLLQAQGEAFQKILKHKHLRKKYNEYTNA